MAVTLKMIAEKAQVSVMAVSAALNGTTRTRISAEKREHIRKIADELGYRPNVIAQSLSGGKSHLIGVVIDSYMNSSRVLMLRGIEEAASANNYRILVAEQHESLSDLIEIFKVFEQYGVDGVICLSHDYMDMGNSLKEILKNMKNIVTWEEIPNVNILSVSIDPVGAYRELVSGWKNSGRTRPALVMNVDFNQQMINRSNLFCQVCREYGLEAEIIKVDAAPTDKRIFSLMEEVIREKLLPHRADCVLAENDVWACSLMGAASKAGINVPRDIAVSGWDNDVFCTGLVPPLASISVNAEEIGRQLTTLLCRCINNESVHSVVVPSEFYCRESCGFGNKQ